MAAAGSAVQRSLPQVQVLVQLLFWGVFMGRIMAVAEAVLSSRFKDRTACSGINFRAAVLRLTWAQCKKPESDVV